MDKKSANPIKRLFTTRGVGQVIIVSCFLVILFVVFGVINPNFYGARNIANLLRQIAPYLIVGIGQSYVMITGNIDLSIGYVVGMSCMMIATLICNGMNPIIAFFIALAACLAVGIINGELVARCKLPPFVATLGTQTICRGLAQLVNNNVNTDSIVSAGSKWRDVAKAVQDFCYYGKFLGIFNTFWIAIALWLIFNFILAYTRTGRHIYAIGSNVEASKLSGVNVPLTIIKAYLVSAFCACVVGFVQCATTGTGVMDAGMSYEMYGVAASVIGGVSTLGGQGILLGTVVGAGVWGVLNNGLQFAGAPVALRNIVIGCIVVLSVLVDVVARQGRSGKRSNKKEKAAA